MVQAKLKFLHSPDLLDLQHDIPVNPENFLILIQAIVGPIGDAGEEAFDFNVCTPSWIEERLTKDSFLLARHYLIVPRYNYTTIWQVIQKICDRTQGPDWITVANRLGRYGLWKFEDFES